MADRVLIEYKHVSRKTWEARVIRSSNVPEAQVIASFRSQDKQRVIAWAHGYYEAWSELSKTLVWFLEGGNEDLNIAPPGVKR